MPVEPRGAGRWIRDGHVASKHTGASAYGYASRREPVPLGLEGRSAQRAWWQPRSKGSKKADTFFVAHGLFSITATHAAVRQSSAR